MHSAVIFKCNGSCVYAVWSPLSAFDHDFMHHAFLFPFMRFSPSLCRAIQRDVGCENIDNMSWDFLFASMVMRPPAEKKVGSLTQQQGSTTRGIDH